MSFTDFDDNEINNENNTEEIKPAYSPLTYRMPDYNMAKWSNTLGIISLAGCPCILPSLILGPVAVILGLLSRGGQDVLPPRAKMGMTLAVIGFLCAVAFFVYEWIVLIQQYGSIDGVMQEYIRILEATAAGR